MSVDWGFESPIFLAKGIVQQAHPLLLKKAVLNVIDHLDNADKTGSSPFEIIDRLVQVILTGEYRAPVQDEGKEIFSAEYVLKDGKLSPEDEAEIKKFLDQLNGLPDGDRVSEDDESYEDFLKRLGIPNLDDYRDDEDKDDDPQPA
jgi:hypothetical protein